MYIYIHICHSLYIISIYIHIYIYRYIDICRYILQTYVSHQKTVRLNTGKRNQKTKVIEKIL